MVFSIDVRRWPPTRTSRRSDALAAPHRSRPTSRRHRHLRTIATAWGTTLLGGAYRFFPVAERIGA
jgi:hypothetical protein